MRNKTNRWHEAIIKVLDASDVSMSPAQIWQVMENVKFKHKSASPRSTLGARLAELVAAKVVVVVGKALYRRATPSHHALPVMDAGVPEDLHNYN